MSGATYDQQEKQAMAIRPHWMSDPRREALLAIIADGRPMTVRQVFYQATVHVVTRSCDSKGLRCRGALKARIGIISTFPPVSGTSPPVHKDRGGAA